MSKRLTIRIGIAAAAAAGAYLLLCLGVPAWWSGSCGPGCERHLSSGLVTPWSITLNGFRIASGDDDAERWEIVADRIVLNPEWLSLLRGRPFFSSAEVRGLAVKLTEGDKPKKGGGGEPPLFSIGSLGVTGGRFTYERKHAGRRGRLTFSKINLEAGAIGTDARRRTAPTSVKLSALMEESGRVEIELGAHFFRADPALTLALRLEGQNLAEANAYFRPIDEIELRGSLRDARCEVRWEKAELNASVALRFNGLDVNFHPGRERSGIAAFLSDLLGGVALREKSEGKSFVPGYARIVRQPKESPAAFVLRGLKEAAMQAAKQ